MSEPTPAGAALSNGSESTSTPNVNTGDNASGCLTSWFVGGRHNKTCPDCRAPVKAQPAPAYLVRAVVQMFTSRPELLDKGETTDEHLSHQREEAERLEKDKANTHPREGGLFRGTFNKKLPVAQPIVDLEDNVVRCPRCSWELEEDEGCAQCGYRQDDESVTGSSGWSESDENSEMTDYLEDDDEIEDGFGDADEYGWDPSHDQLPLDIQPADIDQLYRQWYGLAPGDLPGVRTTGPFRRQNHYGWPSGVSSALEEDSDMDDEDEDADMDSFIDDDLEHDDYSESDRSTVVGRHEISVTHTIGTDLSTFDEMSEESDEESLDDESHDDDDDDDDDDDEDPILPPVGGIRRNRIQTYRIQSSSPSCENGTSGTASGRSESRSQGDIRHDPRLQQQVSAGSTVMNAISVDDDSDEGPVRPTRRTRDRGNRRPSAY
nr:RING finger domain protein [Aspergillus niger CBS 513.88]|eukprot:XP_001401553.2 RING finger domain protein [Aspergillus niger CBS 513.88]